MKLTNKDISALRYRYEKMCRGILGASFRVLEAKPGKLGSTVPANIIYLGFVHEYFKGLDKAHTIFMIDGTYAHEVMHKILSDFSAFSLGAARYALIVEKKVFQIINNIMEDAFIEYHAPEFLGDMLIRALNYMRAVVYKNTPSINEPDESGAEPNDMSQFLNACIQYGDAGLIKGSFTNPVTHEIFAKSLPIMEAHMHEPNPQKRIAYVHEVVELSRPLWEDDAIMEELFKKFMEQMAKEGRSMSDPSGGGLGGSSMAKASSDCTESDSSDKASRRKMTSAMMKSSSKAGNSSGKPSGSSESAEESPSGCGGKTDPSDKKSRSDGKESGSMGSCDNNGDPEDADNSEGSSGSESGENKSDGEEGDEAEAGKSDKTQSSDSSDTSEDSDDDSDDEDDGGSDGDEKSEDGSKSEGDSGSDDDSENTDSSDAADTSDSGESTAGENTDGSDSENSDDGEESEGSDSGSDDAASSEEAGEKADGESPDSEDSDRDNGEPSEDGSEEGSESEEDGGMTPAQALRSAMEEMEVSPEDLDSAEADFESAMRAIESEESETKEDHAVNLDFPVKGGYKKGCSSATCRNIKVKVNPSDRDALALEYEKIVNPMRSMINHLANQLKRILRNDRAEKVYKTSGKISIERLSSGRLTAYMFTKRREPHNKCDADIFILCDESGSMDWGNKSRLCRAAAIALAEALRNLGISLHIVGFTADEGADADHFHYMNGNNTRDTRLALMNISARSNNYDGYSIRYATEYLKKRPSAHKLLIVISDGQPACSRYYSGDDGVRDTAMAIKDASKYFPVVGILIGNENPETHRKMYGYNFIHISNPNDLFSGLAKTIAKQIKNW